MPDAVAVASLVVSASALAVAYRSSRRSARAVEIAEEEHRLRLADRDAKPVLGIEMRPSNHAQEDDGFIRTEATTIYVNLAITVTNQGTKPAGRTHVELWVPAMIESTTLKWMDPAGAKEDWFGSPSPDPSTQLDTGDGRRFGAQLMTRTLESVPLIGETLYLRIACPVPVGGEGMVPVRVRVRTDGSEADETHPIRLRNARTQF